MRKMKNQPLCPLSAEKQPALDETGRRAKEEIVERKAKTQMKRKIYNAGLEYKPVEAIQGTGFCLMVDRRGVAHVEVGHECYTVGSFYSFPGISIGTNALADGESQCEERWKPGVRRVSDRQIEITAGGKYYRLVRTLSIEGHRVSIADSLTNVTAEDVGILMGHKVVPSEKPVEIRIGGGPDPAQNATVEDDYEDRLRKGGTATSAPHDYLEWDTLPARPMTAENPTLFIELDQSSLGVLAEDTISRLQFVGVVGQGWTGFSMRRFGLRHGESRTLCWALYPLGEKADYFTFINQVRRDWRTNFTVQGPYSFFDVVQHHD
ncbi:MAG: hypothetical protein V1800_01970, partial [Candidatus Latescibacterota bacterium]